MFRFRDEVRAHVKAAADLMMYANSRHEFEWCAQEGVYGMASKALEAIIRIECGCDVMDAIENSRYHFNFGGNRDFLEDVEVAVAEAKERIEEEAAMLRECECDVCEYCTSLG